MNKKLTPLAILLVLTLAVSVRGADLVVGVQIDGHSRLVISTGDAGGPAQILWDHLYAARPGTAGGTYPTTLNGCDWFPIWPDTPNGSPGLCSPLAFAGFRFPIDGVSLSQQAGRTPVTIVQQPSAANAFTLIVDFDDSAPAGADQYAVTLQGVSYAPLPDPAQDPQNLIINGSFETPVLALGANYYQPASCLAPWQTDGSCFEIWAPNLPADFAADGRQHLEILSTDAGGTSVWQTVTTVVGADYQLSFYHSPRPSIHSTLTASINSQAIATFDEDGSALGEFNWRRFRTNFTASATSTIIEFSDAAPTAAGTHIDKVVLVRLPLRSTLRVSEVELCWETVSTKTYQVQYQSQLTTNLWTALGAVRPGTGATDCIRDQVPSDQPHRWYRVMTVP